MPFLLDLRAGIYALLLVRDDELLAIYVGSTTQTFSKRLGSHDSRIRHARAYLEAGKLSDNIKRQKQKAGTELFFESVSNKLKSAAVNHEKVRA